MNENGHSRQCFEFVDFRLYPEERLLLKNGKRVPLTPRVLDLLQLLVVHHGKLVTKETILESIWTDTVVEEGNINRTISTIRKSLGIQPNGSDFIETVPKSGYRFIAPVQEISVAYPGITTPSRRPWFLISGAVILPALIGLTGWYLRPITSDQKTPARKNVLVRLTDSPTDEGYPYFTNDGRIRFGRWIDKLEYSHVMNADGSDVMRDTSIPGLRAGNWSPDGKRVFYWKDPGDDSVYLANSDGSGEIKLPFKVGNTAWSPDSTQIVYQTALKAADGSRNMDIFIYNVETGATDNIVDDASFDADPSFAPNGKSILFVSDRDGNAEIYSERLDTREVLRLTNDPGHDSHPSYSPDGTQILFNSDRQNENNDVYLMNSDGSGIRNVTDLQSEEEAGPPSWSHDGTKILLTSSLSGKANIYLMDIEPLIPQKVIETETDTSQASMSPDGTKLVYFSATDENKGEIRIYDTESKTSRVVTAVSRGGPNPTFSRDAQRVLFKDFEDDNSEIFVINADGTARVNLSNNPANDQMPAWSPDGTRVAFCSNRGTSLDHFQIYVMNADGSEQRLVYSDNRGISIVPAWSPDGKTIIFANDFPGGRIGNFELFSIDAEGSGPVRRLTDRPRFDVDAAYSPDGRRIAFVSTSDGNNEIYTMNADGTGLLRVTRDLGEDRWPRWSPDGTKLIFSSNRDGKFAIYEIEI